MITKFEVGQRVTVLAQDECVAPPPSSKTQDMLATQTGTVVRVQTSGEAAWVRMDCVLPEELRSFPADDPSGRGNNVLLWQGEVRACARLRQ